MAAHLEGKGCGMIDMAGLAQKGGSVFSHVRIAKTPEDIHAIRVSAGKADLILGCDLVVSGARKVLAAVRENHTIFVANTAEIMPGEFARSADFSLPVERLKKAIRQAAGEGKSHFFDATRTASALFGNSLGANMFMLGFAYQHGGLPLSAEAVEKAIELNGEAVAMNVSAFRWGRRAAHEPEFVRGLVGQSSADSDPVPQTADDIIARRAEFLTAYQNAAYARRYVDRVAAVRAAETRAVPGSTAVTEAVARNLFKLMAIKDEYEVARLYTDGSFAKQLSKEFQSFDRLEFHLAPPILGQEGRRRKTAQVELRTMDDEGVPAARRAQGPARHRLRRLRLFRGAPFGTSLACPVRAGSRPHPTRLGAGKDRGGRRACLGSVADPRLRARQAGKCR